MPVTRKEVRLRPLPLRITPRQFERLAEARTRDALAIQEHVRRAIDVYLDLIEKRYDRENERGEARLRADLPLESVPTDKTLSQKVAKRTSRPYSYR
jgi:hypothetical protein